MGTLEDFQPNKRSKSTTNNGQSAGEIIIFPGVRREYHVDSNSNEEPSIPEKRTRRKRDRIEIPD